MTNDQSLAYAKHLFNNGYNCAQSVAIAVFAHFGETESVPRKMASGFGGGIVDEKEICGALSGSVMALGWFIRDKNKKNEAVAYYMNDFRHQFGNLHCGNLIQGIALPERHRKCEVFVAFSVRWCLERLEQGKH